MNSATIAKRSYFFISILLAAQVIGWKYILIYMLYMYSIGLQKKKKNNLRKLKYFSALMRK